MIVIDTSVFGALLEGDPNHDEVVEVYRKDSDWKIPDLLVHEVLNISAGLERRGKIDKTSAQRFLAPAVQTIPMAKYDFDVAEAFEIAIEHRLTGYDAEFHVLVKTPDGG